MGRYHHLLVFMFLSLFLMGQEGGCEPVDNDGDGYASDVDCNDDNANIHPDADELCNGVDDNCDGLVDEGFDNDGDGYLSCAGDCDDARDDVFSGAPELCDGVDNDCDDDIDEAQDLDEDGFTLCGGDCDDAAADIHPGATEICDGQDNDCDEQSDEGFDQDGDGFSSCDGDCDDSDALVHPDVEESCNGIDDDCQNGVDDGFDVDGDGFLQCSVGDMPADCDDSDPAVHPGAEEACDGGDDDCDGQIDEGLDGDEDGYLPCALDGQAADCDDDAADINPGATEVCDGVDNDCDGEEDEGFDGDGDGFTTCQGDCNDDDANQNPGLTEICNQMDDDCDGQVDEGFDGDEDGYSACNGDCNDGDAEVYPGADERCNLADDDCDGEADEGFDQDEDGYAICAGDCDDDNALIHPAAVEDISDAPTLSDGADNDCDGFVDIDCDGQGGYGLPALTLRSPQRGLFTDDDSVQVTGHVVPSPFAAIDGVNIAGIDAILTPCSADGGRYFEAEIPLSMGLQTLQIIGMDEDGGSDRAEISLIQSDEFVDLHSEAMDGVLLSQLNEGTWDILAQFLEGSITEDTLEAELIEANPLIDSRGAGDCLDDYHIVGDATQYRQDDVEISFDISKGKVKAEAHLINPRIWATGYVYYDLALFCGGFYDTVFMDAYASFDKAYALADGDVWVDENGQVQVDFDDVLVNIIGSEVAVTADGVVYDWLLDLVEDEMADQVEDFIVRELEDFVDDELGLLLADEVNALELEYELSVLDTDYGIDFDFESADVGSASVDVGMSIGFDYEKAAVIPQNPGVLRYDFDHASTLDPTVAFKLGLNFFNGSLHSLWEGGALHLEGQLYDDPPIYGIANPLLPPVVHPSNGAWPLELAVGDVLSVIEIEVFPGFSETLSAAMSARVPVDIQPVIDGYEIYFDVTFGAVDLTFDLLTDEALEPELHANMEAGLSEMLTVYLDELEVYLESLRISYVPLPVVFTDAYIIPDVINPAVLTVVGEAYYDE